MKTKKWVRSKYSPDAKKFEVVHECLVPGIGGPQRIYTVTEPGTFTRRDLPIDEYVECKGPDRWVDVTAEVEYDHDAPAPFHLRYHGEPVTHGSYQIRKVRVYFPGQLIGPTSEAQDAFIIERKVST
jgi:hypothetical protein